MLLMSKVSIALTFLPCMKIRNVCRLSTSVSPVIQTSIDSSIFDENSPKNIIKKSLLKVAIVGRPNTGKSTLFNRLTGSRQAIVSPVPGTTRDRKDGKGLLAGLTFSIIDTGGLDDRGAVTVSIKEQIECAIKSADVILFLLDARVGVSPIDDQYAQWLRMKMGKISRDEAASGRLNHSDQYIKRDVIVLANKSEGAHFSTRVIDTLSDSLRLGLGDALPVSAAHGDGMTDLALELIAAAKKRGLDDGSDDVIKVNNPITLEEKVVQLAVMGKPNVGKSTLINAFVGHERVITGPTPGLTRDSIHVEWEYNERVFRLVDTAGLTRMRPNKKLLETSNNPATLTTPVNTAVAKNLSNITLPGIELMDANVDPSQFSYQISEMALISALNALRFSQVVLLVVEGSQGKFSKIDLQIGQKCLEEGRALVVAANKKDVVALQGVTGQQYEDGVRLHCESYFKEFGKVPVVACTAIDGDLHSDGIKRVLGMVLKTHDAWSKRINTWILNKWLKDLLIAHPTPRANGRSVQVKYITQLSARPPTFALFCNVIELPGFHERFIRSKLQHDFKLDGVPIRFIIRKTKGRSVNKELLTNSAKSNRVNIGSKKLIGSKKHDGRAIFMKRAAQDVRRRRATRNKRKMSGK